MVQVKGKYHKYLFEPKEETQDHSVEVHDALIHIANELAEQNRIKRIELGVELKARAYRGMFKTFKSTDGKSYTVPPTEKDKKNCQAEWDEIEKLMEDHA